MARLNLCHLVLHIISSRLPCNVCYCYFSVLSSCVCFIFWLLWQSVKFLILCPNNILQQNIGMSLEFRSLAILASVNDPSVEACHEHDSLMIKIYWPHKQSLLFLTLTGGQIWSCLASQSLVLMVTLSVANGRFSFIVSLEANLMDVDPATPVLTSASIAVLCDLREGNQAGIWIYKYMHCVFLHKA